MKRVFKYWFWMVAVVVVIVSLWGGRYWILYFPARIHLSYYLHRHFTGSVSVEFDRYVNAEGPLASYVWKVSGKWKPQGIERNLNAGVHVYFPIHFEHFNEYTDDLSD